MTTTPQDTQRTPTSLRHIATELDGIVRTAQKTPLAADRRSRDAYGMLAEVSRELRANQVSRFTGPNPPSSYPLEVLLPDRLPRPSFVRAASVLTVLRDLSVFFPVAYTWWQLSQVLPKYRGGANDSFIGDWAAGAFPDGHGGSTSVQPLGTTALVIAGVIALIILLTLVAHALAFWTDLACDLTTERRRLAGLIASVDAALAPSSISAGGPRISVRQLEALGRSFAGSAEALKDSLTQVGEEIRTSLDTGPGSRFATSLDSWTAAAASLTAATATLRIPAEALREFLGAQKDVTAKQLQLSVEMGALIKQVQDFTKAASEGAHLHRGVGADVARAAQRLGETLAYFQGRVSALDGTLQGLHSATRTSSSDAGESDNDDWRFESPRGMP